MSYFEWRGNDLILRIKVQPRSSREGFSEILGDRIKLCLNAPPVDGKANTQLIRYLSKYFGVARQHVDILSGETSREKRVQVHAPARNQESFR
jgi:uncharacterized protein (TIGR00251 family)